MNEAENSLYVGGMNVIMKLDMNNISQTDCQKHSVSLPPEENSNRCYISGKQKHYDCMNHIRVIQPIGDGSRIYVCGTGAYNPRGLILYRNLSRLSSSEYFPDLNELASCPHDPDENITALWIDSGNPDNLAALYAGTSTDSTGSHTLFIRNNLYNLTWPRPQHLSKSFRMSVPQNSHWLDDPNFVAMHDIGDYVYIFFRENAMEQSDCEKTVVSRVARVCKKDRGGKSMLEFNWVTFVKARLLCSIPADYPFHFNEIQSVYKLPGDDSRFYAVFTTSMTGLVGSAICSFTLRDINAAFSGRFKVKNSSTSIWLPVSGPANEEQPGKCVEDTHDLSVRMLSFVQSHTLMQTAVQPEGGRPLFYRRDLVLTHLVVNQFESATFDRRSRHTVYYAGSNTGLVYKVVEWNNGGVRQSNLVDIIGATHPEPTRQMAISDKLGYVYVSSDSQIQQMALSSCSDQYDTCLRCVRDPHCGWNKSRQKCHSYRPGLLQDVAGATSTLCNNWAVQKQVTAGWGQTLHLSCDVKLPSIVENTGATYSNEWQIEQLPLDWILWNQQQGQIRIVPRTEKYLLTRENGLVVLAASEADTGRYEARYRGQPVCSYTVHVQAHQCQTPQQASEYRRVYADWCNQMEKYRSQMEQWRKKQTQCGRGIGSTADRFDTISSSH